MLGQSPEFLSVLRTANLAAATDVPILILGESGTGKELLASHIHRQSPRVGQTLHIVNCAALPESLIESELFGHKKGAFTGAEQSREGRLPAANGATLFLDEIGELPLGVQSKLLRFLESGECQRVGDNQVVRSNVRVIAATHQDLQRRVEEGLFRADLFYRLNVVPVTLPPLRQRGNDIPLLLGSLGLEAAERFAVEAIRFDKTVQKFLRGYPWPGNIRELRNLCERMTILFAGQTITMENLPLELSEGAQADEAEFILPESGINLEELEQNLIRQALNKSRGNRSQAARLLGLSRDTLLYRIKKYALQ